MNTSSSAKGLQKKFRDVLQQYNGICIVSKYFLFSVHVLDELVKLYRVQLQNSNLSNYFKSAF